LGLSCFCFCGLGAFAKQLKNFICGCARGGLKLLLLPSFIADRRGGHVPTRGGFG
jgi:hypothetical protein